MIDAIECCLAFANAGVVVLRLAKLDQRPRVVIVALQAFELCHRALERLTLAHDFLSVLRDRSRGWGPQPSR